MSFPQSVVDKALVACGRRCCICHKFCRKNMEIHHIKQHADGGADTFDNAIPLCFECHADMGKTDPHHPKGRNYTAAELKMHRDRWYDIVASGKADNEAMLSDMTEEDARRYRIRYMELRFEVSCTLDFYANVYSNVVEETDDRHEKASDDLRRIGVKIKAFAKEERPENTDVPSVIDLEDAGGHFIGLSNGLYYPKGGDKSIDIEHNLRREDRIREVFGL